MLHARGSTRRIGVPLSALWPRMTRAEREALGGYWAALWDPAPEGEQCSVKGCAQAAAYELVVRERTLLFWLCGEHGAQGGACVGPVRSAPDPGA